MSNKKLNNSYMSKINAAFDKILYGESDLHIVESGVAVFIDQNRATGVKPKTRAIVSMNPTASVLVKKKAFSTFKATNDLRWMDKTEKMLLRATKALFAFKVAQLRAYESLTKLDKFYDDTGDINFALLADLISSTRYLQLPSQNNKSSDALALLASFGAAAGIAASVEDVIKIVRRNAFSTANTKTTWIVDPDDVTNYGTGPGTGVIELCTFTSISTSVGITSESKSASINLVDPHRIMNIIEDDIEMAIEEALYGTLGLMNDLAYAGMGGEYIDPTLIVSSALEVFGLGNLDSTIDVDYIRDRLRVFYLGKWIISVGDGIHIYISSNKSVTGNNDIENDSFDSSLDPSYFQIDETMLEAERKLYTNQNIDSSTYKNIRKFSNNSFTMQHVFGGYVKSISESYAPDKSSLTISCQDNMGWLASVRFMEEPTFLDPRASLEDPITPFNIKATSDSSVSSQSLELLDENKILLRSGLLSHDSGLLTGYNANESNIFQGQYSGSGSLYGAQIVQHPSGLVYRWRTGVLGITSSLSATGASTSGTPSALSPVTRQDYGLSVTNSVVIGLDVANVISVMITGQPYNIETFTQLAFDAMNVIRKGSSLNPSDALSATLDSLRKQNPFYGNFKPFRMITMSEQTINKLSNDNFALEDTKSKLSILRKRKNDINRKIRILKGSVGNESIILLLSQEIASIDYSINSQIEAINRNNGSPLGNGIDQSDLFDINFNIFGQNKILGSSSNLESDYDINRAMMKVATMRRIEDVKLNRDQNLLIVSDQYDLNPDIKAYILKLRSSNFKLFQGNYLNVYDRCVESASVTMMEFFCNSQGHLEIRPPQYNKTPLSVLNALSKYQAVTNRKIVPEFLFKMFGDRVSSTKLEIHATNLKIAIIALMMGRYPDRFLIPGVHLSGKASLKFFGISYSSEEMTGTVKFDKTFINLSDTHSNYLSLDIGTTEDGDILFGDVETQIGDFDEIIREYGAGKKSGISIYDNTLNSLLNPNKNISANSGGSLQNQDGKTKSVSEFGTPEQVVASLNGIINAFRMASGINPASGLPTSGPNGTFVVKDLLIGTSDPSVRNSGILESRLEKLFDELEQAVSKRGSLVTLLQKNEEKKAELDRIEADISNGFSENNTDFWEDPDIKKRVDNFWGYEPSAYKGIVEGLYEAGRYTKRAIDATRTFLTGSATQGSLFDHLIDDDTRNLLGPGSGKRFIIYDEHIKGYSVSETEPQMTRIDIFGSTPLVGDQTKQVTGGENLIQWAGAVDYDLWRQYGHKSKSLLDLPFISDPETQGKPLALQQLALQRAVIFSGSIQVSGNEYYQPGDTVYIPSKGLLFYVASVSHSFTFGSSFDTNLTLMYGHAPGTYLPTPMDIIGQSYSKDYLKQGGYIVKRKGTGDDKYNPLQPDCALRFPKSPKITDSNLEYLLSHKNNMVKFYNMITDLANGVLTSNRVLLIRGFIKDDSEESDVMEKLNIVSGLFQNPVMLSQKLDTAVGDDLLAEFLEPTQTLLNINAGSGMNKELKTIFLPNGASVPKVPKQQILLQVSKLNRDSKEFVTSNTSYKCFSAINLKNLGSLSKLGKDAGDNISDFDRLSTSLYSDLPKGGPSQSTWLEMEDLLQNIFASNSLIKDYEKVIEIGILTLDSAKVKLLASLR
jgi:hypothetical protein